MIQIKTKQTGKGLELAVGTAFVHRGRGEVGLAGGDLGEQGRRRDRFGHHAVDSALAVRDQLAEVARYALWRLRVF